MVLKTVERSATTFGVKTCADPEGGQGSGPPGKLQKNIGILSSTGPDPLKSQSYQASIQCWAIIGPPANAI